MRAHRSSIGVIGDSPMPISRDEPSVRRLGGELTVFDSPADSLTWLRDHEVEHVFLDFPMRRKDRTT